jgi:hypothetical protein
MRAIETSRRTFMWKAMTVKPAKEINKIRTLVVEKEQYLLDRWNEFFND